MRAEVTMRALFGLLLLAALAAPSDACETWGRGYRSHYGYRGYSGRPYWHHPYYARFGYQRPYLFYRQLRYFGYRGYMSAPYAQGYYGGCGGPIYYTYYPAYVTVAPLYSRLSVALTIDDLTSRKTDRDGLPRARTGPVGSRFLKDIR
jgi:hypothetical protein